MGNWDIERPENGPVDCFQRDEAGRPLVMGNERCMARAENWDEARRYDDIIDLPHHVSQTHPRMSMLNRAAQFAPFAALTGYGAAIDEAARLTQRRIELSEGEQEALNEKLSALAKRLPAEARITRFVADPRKEGGRYLEENVTVRRILPGEGSMILTDGRAIDLDCVIDVEGIAP